MAASLGILLVLTSCQALLGYASTYTVTVTQSSGGSIAISPTKTQYSPGDVVSVTATPSSGYVFVSWNGALSGSTNPATLTINSNATIGAVFALQQSQQYTITLTQTSGGTISISPQKSTYSNGDSVIVTATPSSGYTFGSWSGGISGTTNPISITISSNLTISATFTAPSPSISVSGSASSSQNYGSLSVTYTITNNGNTPISITNGTYIIYGSAGLALSDFVKTTDTLVLNTPIPAGQSVTFSFGGYSASYVPYSLKFTFYYSDSYGHTGTYVATGNCAVGP
ncbi:MAG TPA: InlB B-repeat-containing protein [Rectinemataceae bacterium]|nr:InlB B-repeat-containing protein [Rectinemataceae bacterium]